MLKQDERQSRRAVSRTFCSPTLFTMPLALMFSMYCWGCTKPHVETLTTSGDAHTYFELDDGKRRQKVYTEIQPNRMVVVVMDEDNHPQLIKASFPESAGRSATLIMEFSESKDIPSPGRKLLTESFVRPLIAGNAKFEQWKSRYLSFPAGDPKVVTRYVITAELGDSEDQVMFIDNGRVAFRIKDYFCGCRNVPAGTIYGVCLNTALRCAMDNLCDLWGNCIETGEWGPACSGYSDTARACIGEYTS